MPSRDRTVGPSPSPRAVRRALPCAIGECWFLSSSLGIGLNRQLPNAHGARRPAHGLGDGSTARSRDGTLAEGPLAVFTWLLTEGEGSNNIAELWGPAMLLQLLERHEETTGKAHGGPIAIFTVSQLTIDILRYIFFFFGREEY